MSIDADAIETSLRRIVEAVREAEDSENGTGSFDFHVMRGEIIGRGSTSPLTPEEAAFVDAPPPSKRH